MTSKNVNLGIEKLVERKDNINDLTEKTWRDLRNKLDSMLIGNNVLKTSEVRNYCQQLDGMSLEERKSHIASKWGGLYADRAMPLLLQLDALENHISKKQS